MILIEEVQIWGLGNALNAMRNPLESWEQGDTLSKLVGSNDLALARKLIKAGPSHRKFLRQILIGISIRAPLYWWKEFDTYKVGTVANSCSTMHTIHKKELSMEDFSLDYLNEDMLEWFKSKVLYQLNNLIGSYNVTKSKEDWYALIQLLPSSFNQFRYVTCNFETLYNIYELRHNHKLEEWKKFCERLKDIAVFKQLMGGVLWNEEVQE